MGVKKMGLKYFTYAPPEQSEPAMASTLPDTIAPDGPWITKVAVMKWERI